MLLLFVLASTVARGRQRWHCIALGLSLLLALAAGTCFLAAFLKLEDRALLPAIFYASAWFLVLGFPSTATSLPELNESFRFEPQQLPVESSGPLFEIARVRRPFTMRSAVLAATSVGILCGLFQDFSQLRELDARNQRRHAAFKRLTAALISDCSKHGDRFITFVWGAAFPYEWWPPFSRNSDVLDSRFVSWGWASIGPLYDRCLANNRIHGCAYALRQHRNVYLVCPGGYDTMLVEYLKEHYQVKTVAYRDKHVYDFSQGPDLREEAVSVVRPVIRTE
jgi:hypothetical protein